MRCKIGVKLGKVLESELYSYPNKATIVKTKILFDSRKTLQLGVYLDGVKDGTTWVDFKYEKIHLFCFNYGIIGHSKDLCTQARKKNPWNPMLNNLSDLGSDLQNLGGKSSTKRKKNYSRNHMVSPSYGPFSLIPEALGDKYISKTISKISLKLRKC